jgi:flagellar basal-body rod modification protein FlgD
MGQRGGARGKGQGIERAEKIEGESMATAASLFTHGMTAGQSLAPLDTTTGSSGTSGSGSSSGSDSGSATISANDFLELLVTEMQNQDPTDETDPNEYIDQLVDVNSLEQLIDINQTLSGAFGTPSSSGTGDSTPAQTGSATPAGPASSTPGVSGPSARTVPFNSAPAAPVSGALAAFHSDAGQAGAAQLPRRVSGNLSMPAAIPAAQRVAHALDGKPRARPLGGKLSRLEQTSLNNRP